MSDQATLEILIQIRDELSGLTRTKDAIKDAADQASGFGQALKTGFGVAIAQKGLDMLVTSLKDFVVGAFQMAVQIKEQSANLGLSAEAYQVLGNVISDAGGDVGQLTMALTIYRGKLDEVRNGTGTASAEFRRLGLDVDQLSRLPLELQLERVAKAILSSTNQTRAFDSAVQILGARNAPRLMGALKELATEGYGKLADAQKEAGRIMSDNTVNRLAEAEKQIKKFKQEMAIAVGEKIGDILEQNPDAGKDLAKGLTTEVGWFMQLGQWLGATSAAWIYGMDAYNNYYDGLARRSKDTPPKLPGTGPVMATPEEATQANLQYLQQAYQAASGEGFTTETEKRGEQLGIIQQIVDLENEIMANRYADISLDSDENGLTKAQLTQLQEKRKLFADITKWQQEGAKIAINPAGGETQAFRKIQDEYQHVNDRHGNPNYMTTSEGWQAGAMDWVKSLGSAGEQASQLLNQTLGQTFSSLTNDIWEATKGTQSWGQSFRDLGDIAGRMLTEILLKMAMIQAINAVLGLFPATAGAGTVSAGASTLGSAGSTMQISSAGGGSFLTHGPTHFTVGDNPGGVELVRVIPLSGIGRTSISGSAAQLAMAGGGVALVAGNAAAAGGGDTFHFTYQFNGGVSREEVLAILPKMVEASKAAVLDAQKRRRDGFR